MAQVFSSDSIVFEWNQLDPSSTFTLQVSSSSDFQNLLTNRFTTGHHLKIDLSEGRYYWRVVEHSAGFQDTSQTSLFKVFDPLSVSGLNLWAKSTDKIGFVSGNQMNFWGDNSPQSNDMTQNSGFRQTTLVDSILDTFPVVRFDDFFDQFNLSNSLDSQDYSVAMVYTYNGSSNRCRIVFTVNQWYIGINAFMHSVNHGGSFLSGTTYQNNRFVVQHAFSANDTLYHFINGDLKDKGATNVIPGSGIKLGQDTPEGDFLELMMVNGTVSDSVRLLIDNYLMDKYAPPVNLGINQTKCSGPFVLSAFKDSYLNYAWSNGQTDSVITVNTPGQYSVSVTDMFGRVSVDTVLLETITSAYSVDIPADTSICEGESVQLNAGPDYYNYQWSNGDTTSSLTAIDSGVYSITVTDCFSNVSIDSISINYDTPSFRLPADTVLCAGEELIIRPSAAVNGSFLWSTSSTADSISVMAESDYSLTITNPRGCSFSDSIQVLVDSSLVNFSLGSDTSLCRGNIYDYQVPLIDTLVYQWSNGVAGPSLPIDSTSSYVLTASSSTCNKLDTINISVKGDAPQVDFSFSNTCFGDSTLFIDQTVDPNGISLVSYEWRLGNGDTSFVQNPKVKYDSAITYIVELEVKNDSTCTALKIDTVVINALPTGIIRPQSSCQNDSVNFMLISPVEADSIVSYKWQFNAMANDTSVKKTPKKVFTTATDTPIKLSLVSEFGCSDTLYDTLIVNPKPNADFSFSGIYLDDSTSFINVSTISNGRIDSLIWNFGNGLTSSDSISTIYYGSLDTFNVSLIAITDSVCSDTVDKEVIIINRPPPEPKFNTVFPKIGQTLKGAFTFRWNYREIGDEYQIQIAKDSLFSQMVDSVRSSLNRVSLTNLELGRYFWRVIADSNGTAVDTSNIANFSLFDVYSIDSLYGWFRSDSNVVYDTNNLEIDEWGDVSGLGSRFFQTQSFRKAEYETNVIGQFPGLKFNDQFDKYGFSGAITDSVYTASLVYSSNATQSLKRILYGSAQWYIGLRFGSHIAHSGGPINGKIANDSSFVVHTVHSNGDTTYNRVNGVAYDKKESSEIPGTISLSENAFDGYAMEIILINGESSLSMAENIDQYLMNRYAPPIDLGPDQRHCTFPIQLDIGLSDSYTKYSWSTGDSTASLQVDSAGLYKVTVTDIFERDHIDSVFIIQDTANYRVKFAQEDTTICKGDEIELLAGFEAFDYQWSNQDTTFVTKINTAGNYKVTVTDCKGQVSVDSIQVLVNEPQFDLGIDTTICFNEPLSISPDSNFTNVSYQWSNGESSPFITIDTAGLYKLKVVDQYSCSFQDSINVQVDSSLFGITLGPDTTLCAFNRLSLKNPPSNIISYSWSAGSTSPDQIVGSSGQFRVTVSNGQCFNSDTIQVITNGTAPNVNFSFNNLCSNDTTEFIDRSNPRNNDLLTDWSWEFGDGTISNMRNPSHYYAQLDTFKATLTVTTMSGCKDTTSHVVPIRPTPNAWFLLDSTCSKSTSQFTDSSTISSGSITRFSWDFGDPSTNADNSIQENPLYTYDTLGNYTVTHSVESNLGCVDSVQRIQIVNPTPLVNFSFDGNCLSDSTFFFDETLVNQSLGDSLVDYTWFFNNYIPPTEISKLKSPVKQFSTEGITQITLRVKTNRSCEARHVDTLFMRQNPQASFTVEEYCEDLPFTLISNSISTDSIASFLWFFEQNDTSELIEPTVKYEEPGNYSTQLKIKTIYGCEDSTSSEIRVSQKPTSDFTILNNGSGAPYSPRLQNKSMNATNYLWFSGAGDSSDTEIPNFTYQDSGTYNLTLITTTDIGCKDTLSKKVNVDRYYLDALLEDVFLNQTTDGRLEVLPRIVNSGNNTIQKLKLTAFLNNEFQFTEEFIRELDKGDQSTFSFTSSFLQGSGKKVDFVCVKIEKVNGVEDELGSNNEACKLAFNNEVKVNVFPNPVKDLLRFSYALPISGDATIKIYDQLGRELISRSLGNIEKGYYLNQIDLSVLSNGVYFYQFIFNGVEYEGPFIKE
ncbi:MAG: PKD domain-containing protein [Vicingaceae bacterium]